MDGVSLRTGAPGRMVWKVPSDLVVLVLGKGTNAFSTGGTIVLPWVVLIWRRTSSATSVSSSSSEASSEARSSSESISRASSRVSGWEETSSSSVSGPDRSSPSSLESSSRVVNFVAPRG